MALLWPHIKNIEQFKNGTNGENLLAWRRRLSLPPSQDARTNHVRVERSSWCFPGESVSSPSKRTRIWLGRYNKALITHLLAFQRILLHHERVVHNPLLTTLFELDEATHWSRKIQSRSNFLRSVQPVNKEACTWCELKSVYPRRNQEKRNVYEFRQNLYILKSSA